MLSSLTRFARNGGVDAKDFQRVWREREQLFSEPDPAPGGEVGRREEASRPGGEARQEGRREGGGGGVAPEKIFEVSVVETYVDARTLCVGVAGGVCPGLSLCVVEF